MSIVTRSGSETAPFMLAREDEVNGRVAWQGVWMVQQMESSEAPVDSIQTKMLGQPIFQLILTLSVHEYEPPQAL